MAAHCRAFGRSLVFRQTVIDPQWSAWVTALTNVRTLPEEAAVTAPFFIVGSGRSGSTMLRLMLASHSRLAIPPETWFLTALVKRFSVESPLGADEVESAVSIMTGHYRWADMKLDAQELRRQVSRLREPYLRDLLEIVYRWHGEGEGKARWGDKTPQYIEIVPELLRMYPDARFIALFRDGRDVVKSFQNAPYGRWSLEEITRRSRDWNAAVKSHWRWTRSEFRQRILLVRYENLVVEPEATLREICQFIGERFEPQMLSFATTVDKQVPARERKYHPKLNQSVDSHGVARWKREMSVREVFVAEAFMASHLRRLGYELCYSGSYWAPAFALTRLCCRTGFIGYEMVSRLRRRLLALTGQGA